MDQPATLATTHNTLRGAVKNIRYADAFSGLRLAQGITDRKSTMPMLANVLLRTQGKNQLLVAATDVNVSLTAELKSHNASDGGIAIGFNPSAIS
jgi:DNA polymerase-3 subunit beta